MYPSMKAEIAARDGDLRLCLLLGIAAWFLFVDHVPHNAVSMLTLRNFGFSGATDLFVFVGGYTAAILYGKMMLERGFIVTATRVFKRLWQLYAAYVVLFVIYIDLIGYVARKTAAPEIIGEFNVTGIVDHTIRTLIYGLLLQAKPLNLDVLQLFIVLMAFFPFALFGMMRRPNLTLAASIGIYGAARYLDWNLSSYPDGRWYFNPFCWQLLFVLGAWLALSGARTMRAIRALQKLSILRVAAVLYLLFALTVTLAGKFPQLAAIIPEPVLDTFLPNDKENIVPLPRSAFPGAGLPRQLPDAAGLARLSVAGSAAADEVRRRMATRVLRRRVPVVCRTFYPDHGPGFTCHAGSRQHRRNGRHDRRCLLRVVVQTAGPEARARAHA
jgi:OpgC protein